VSVVLEMKVPIQAFWNPRSLLPLRWVRLSSERRSWPAITIDILEVTLVPSNKMRVMYKSNLNFERFNKYFVDLLHKGFIEETNDSNGRRLYKTTERGRAFLEVLRKAHEFASSEGT